MSLNLTHIVLVCLIVFLASWLAVKQLIVYLRSRDIVDRPNERSLHEGAIPRGGGLVIVASLLILLFLTGIFTGRYAMFFSLSVVVTCWSSLSWYDDKHDLSSAFRFVAQCVIAVVTVLAYGAIQEIQLGELHWFQLSWFGPVCTIVGILWMANLFNFMDGVDGLAASQTIIASLTMGLWFWSFGEIDFTLICFGLAASTYAFLLWNWQPARIFMGDVGSITIGALFGTLLTIAVVRYDFPVVSFVILFSVFICDTTLTLCRRVVRREKFWLAHRTHYYQRLANVGVSHSKIVVAEIILMCLCSLIASVSVLYRDMIWLCIISASSLMLVAGGLVVRVESHNSRKE